MGHQRVLAAHREEPQVRSGRARVSVRQDLDLAAVGAVSLQVVIALERGARTVLLDMAACKFVDLTGHRLLRGLREHVRSAGAELVLYSVSPRAQRLLDLLDSVDCEPMPLPRALTKPRGSGTHDQPERADKLSTR